MPRLFMIKIGARPKGRLIEQHDIYFGIGEQIGDFVESINSHWSEVKNKWHVDAYRQVTVVDNYRIQWQATTDAPNINTEQSLKLFFINLGGYLAGEFEEFHHKLLIVAPDQADAIKQAKQSEFHKRFSFQDKATPFNAASHIDDKQQVDIDEIYNVNDLLSGGRLMITPLIPADTNTNAEMDGALEQEDKSYIGYLSLKKLRALSDSSTL
ncbi:DUF1543 domain-containing protein [Psychrobacter sp. 16-MNA-CIBAN-0192]|uniref:DUF1543 domain-containing protein n=1 Tax=Psychrobacter sp. 16-MNA-CIBAN-0192 TaxID=3140448 RepID=UPI0033279656